MSTEKITAEVRTEFGKGAARRIRREDKIPAVVYSRGSEPLHVTLPGHETMMALKHHGSNALLELTINGEEQLAMTKQVQIDSIHRLIEHIDFLAVKRGEKVTVDVDVHLVGEAAPGTLVVTDATVLSIEAEATNVPEGIEVDIEGVEPGTQILAGQIPLPAGSVLVTDPETLVVNVTEAQEIAEEPAEAEAEVAEGEGEPAEETAEAEAPAEGE